MFFKQLIVLLNISKNASILYFFLFLLVLDKA